MKREYVLALLAFLFMSMSTVAITYAGEQAQMKDASIHHYDEDITGDGKKDSIVLKGMPFEKRGRYLKKIRADISTSDGKAFRIDYEPGYEPALQFVDLNHDGVKDVLGFSESGGSGGIIRYRLDTFSGGVGKSLPLPPALKLAGKFEDVFAASLRMEDTKSTYFIDLRKRKDDYIRLGIYQHDGTLNEPLELMIDPVAVYKPQKVKGKKGFGLTGYQQVSGAYHADRLGTVVSTWYFEDGKWQLINAKWQRPHTS
ncbi:hypothetical protein [Heyndrickxia acidiproducens]|uniref:hypothetical protein n=1 Tax=Heyndrickxia acidiproducens TaxID=1121084 RepID=UPI0003812ED3|nr:hypothetical protein [Heyndrickxia acidiproducens]